MTSIAIDATDVYWAMLGANPGEGEVRKASKSCGETTTLAPDLMNPRAVAVDDTHVYWLADDGVGRVSKTGGASEVLVPLPLTDPYFATDIAVDAERVYYSVWGNISAVDKAGGMPVSIFAPNCGPLKLAIDDTDIYTAGDGCEGNVTRVPKAGGEPRVVVPGVLSADVAVDATHVYWFRHGYGELWASPKAGGDSRRLDTGEHGGAIALDDTRVYANGLDSLQSVEKSGAGAVAIRGADAVQIVADESGVYFARTDSLGKAERPADTGSGAPPAGTGSVELSWLVNRDKKCNAGALVSMALIGPTSVMGVAPCDDYQHTLTGLAPGSYTLRIELHPGGEVIGYDVSPVEVGTGPFVFPEPFDLGKCSFGGCGGKTVGCVDDGVCGPDDDCVCADCAADAYCNPDPQACPNDGKCEPYYEGCSCADCAAHPSCQ